MPTISVPQRRQTLVRCHCLGGDAGSPEDVTRAVAVLHATDPASVSLSVLARSAGSTFLLLRKDVPLVREAVSTPLAATRPRSPPTGHRLIRGSWPS